MAKMTCPECETSIEIPDDPRMAQLVEALNTQQKTLERFAEMLADLGKKVTIPQAPVPNGVTVTKRKKGDALYEGVFFSYVLDEDEA